MNTRRYVNLVELYRISFFFFFFCRSKAKLFSQQKFLSLAMAFLTFQGARNLRQRLLLSLLSGRPIKIEKIRPDGSEPGLKGLCRPKTL